jgi:hypothetical protein
MPQIINNLVLKVLAFVKEFFHADHFEYGTIAVSPHDNNKQIFVRTERDVVKVWFSVIPHDLPYHDEPSSGWNYVSEVMPVRHGFIFHVQVSGHARIDWFVIEETH